MNDVCISPEVVRICEDNSCFGGNLCEEINRECIEAPVSINDVCCRSITDVPVYAGCGGCPGVGGCAGIGC